jgi:hypothetical protein
MPSALKNNLFLKASDEGIVVEWWPTPRWHILEGYVSIGLTLPGWCANGDDALSRPIMLVAATIWNLLHLTQGD